MTERVRPQSSVAPVLGRFPRVVTYVLDASSARWTRVALRAAAALVFALVAGAILDDPPYAIAACALIAVASATLPAEVAFALFVSSAVWKTAPLFGSVDSPLPTLAVLFGWVGAVASRSQVRMHLASSVRATAVLLPLTLWLFLSTFIFAMGRSGYLEALRFCAVVILPAFLLAIDITPRRVASYAAAIAAAGTMVAIAAFITAASSGRLWTAELLLFRENQVAFGRVVAIGFLAALCLVPAVRGRAFVAASVGASLVCATAVAHSTSRGAAVTAAICAAGLLLITFLLRDRWSPRRAFGSLAVTAVATAYLVVSAISFFPTGRGVQSLAALPSELPQFVNVPLLSQSVPTRPPGIATTETAPPTAPTETTVPTSQAPTSIAPSPPAVISARPTPDPALVAYEPDLSLAYRLERYRIAVAQFMLSPVFGLGYTHGVLARDGQDYAHNIFLEVASELGIVGLACLALVLIAVVRQLARWRQRWEFLTMGILLSAFFLMAQTSGNLTINRFFFILCVALLAMSAKARPHDTATASTAALVAG